MVLHPGDRIDRYRLVRPLGEGGQGSVWQVVDPLDEGAPRALKIVRLSEAGQAAFARARREAKILAHLEHPGLCGCHGLFEDLDQGLVGVVLDLVQGSSLDAVMHEPRFGEQHRHAVLSQVAHVLAYVHAAGLAHRDLKPSNVLITDDFWVNPELPGAVKLVDFGIAVPIGNPHRLTSVGGVIGTVRYLSPELFGANRRAAAEESCARDMFAFGVIAWELLFGAHPAGLGPSASFEAMAQRYTEIEADKRPFPPRRAPGPFGIAITHCLAFRPEDRPENGAALLEVLRTGKPPPRRAVAPPMSSRTSTHEPAPSVRPDPAPAELEPAASRTAPKPAPIVPPPAPRKKAARAAGGPVYALALAIALLAGAIYLKPPGQTSDQADAKPILSANVTPTATGPAPAPSPLPEPPQTTAKDRSGPCCGGAQCARSLQKPQQTECAAPADHCFKCTSGRDYIAGPCATQLAKTRPFRLRLARVESDPNGLYVYFRRAGDSTPPIRIPASGGADAKEWDCTTPGAQCLALTMADLVDPGLEIEIKNEAGGRVAYGNRLKKTNGLLASVLCIGVKYEVGKKKIPVDFYLDDPAP